ncbi:FliA/WhiG family RNA polymerase sigma factor [Ammoniphilus sp. CFH 90114]|uniref:FliA/WhiG family RNA polymerase sigma factor n=1 Tax=Ammoniphilus sp. CFH 90114 TaxID=2493665 RepID=UPI001F0CC801|nr:FliA/WhiG family RNA polymerase sigma factor [Ammoniphilus sp. CFH 90114]
MARTGEKKALNVDLWRRWRDGNNPEAEEELIRTYLPLVHYVVGRLSIGLPGTVDKGDLQSFGHLGLMDAMKKFDFERGLQFETYAMWRIRGAIMDGLRESDLIPRSARDKAKRIEEAYLILEQQHLRSVSDREVSDYLGISEKDLGQAFSDASFASLLSLDEPVHDEEEQKAFRQSFIVDEKAKDPQKSLDEAVQKRILADAIDRLSEKERTVVSLFYYEDLTLTEIAEIMSLSPSRISQIHSKALLRIRALLNKN